jgi:hypothetical protein
MADQEYLNSPLAQPRDMLGGENPALLTTIAAECGRQARVVSSRVSKLCRSRLLMPINVAS